MPNAIIDPASLSYIGITLFIAWLSGGFSKFYFRITNGIIIQAGLIAALIGLISILQNMSDPKELGPDMAVALLPIFYAMILSAGNFLVSKNLTLIVPDPKKIYQIGALFLWGLLLVLAVTQSSGLAPFVDGISAMFIALCITMIFLVDRFQEGNSFLKNTATYLPYAGLIGFLMGLIGVLQNINDPRSIGPAMAISLLTLTYSNIISVAIKLTNPAFNEKTDNLLWNYLGICLLLIAVLFIALLASF